MSRRALVACGIALAAPAASGQFERDRASGWNFDRSVDAGYSDVGPLTASLRLEGFDLRSPDDWDRVYQLKGIDGDLFARRSGGLTAIFDRSQYIDSPYGTLAKIPAGTIYVIGEPPPWLIESLGLGGTDDAADQRRADNRVDTALATRISMRYEPTPTAAPDDAQVLAEARRETSIWFNDEARQARVKRLLDRAQKASKRD